MNRKPFNNKSDYDPGRFRSTISFLKQTSTKDPSGGTDVATIVTYTCKAIELQVRDAAQLEISVGASTMNEDRWFVIRFYSGFTPAKDMNIQRGTTKYVIRGIVPVDEPIHYYRLLCIRQNG